MKLAAISISILAIGCGGSDPVIGGTSVLEIDAGEAITYRPLETDPWNTPAYLPPDYGAPAEVPNAGPMPIFGVAPPVFPLMSVPPPGPLIAGGHQESIRALATIDDGSAALSADFAGGVRLWPSLDGTHEPVVVAMASPAALAIARDGAELVLVGLDDAGALELVRTSAVGEMHLRARMRIERPVAGVIATPTGIVALLDDHSIALFDLRGMRTGTLVPEPGETVAAIVARHGHVLALIAGETGTRGRWIVPGSDPTWGEATAILKIDPATAVLAPDFARIAATTLDRKKIVIVELATGKVLATPTRAEDNGEEGSSGRELLVPMGFLDDKTLAIDVDNQVRWWNGTSESTETFAFGAFSIVDHTTVQPNGSALMLESPTKTRYLGYRVSNASSVRPTPTGFVVASGNTVIDVDRDMRERRVIKIPAIATLSSIDNVIPLDATHAFAVGRAEKGTEVYRIDFEHPKATELVASAQSGIVQYEPATRLFAIQDGDDVWFGHFDPKTGKTEQPVRFYANADLVRLVDPTTTGLVAIIVEANRDSSTVDVIEIKNVRVGRDEPFEVARRRTIEKTDEELDRGFASPEMILDRVGYSFGHRHPNADGSLVVSIDEHRIALRERDVKTPKWTIVNPGVDDVTWTADGGLAAIGGAIASIDVATGALGDRQCGWGFGLWSQDAVSGFNGTSVCDAE